MTREEIIQTTHSNFSEFRQIWKDHSREQGLGALVFNSDEDAGDEDDIDCEYWTIHELRGYLRRMEEFDEVMYQWLVSAVREGGYPIVIFSRDDQPGKEQLHVSSVTNKQVS